VTTKQVVLHLTLCTTPNSVWLSPDYSTFMASSQVLHILFTIVAPFYYSIAVQFCISDFFLCFCVFEIPCPLTL